MKILLDPKLEQAVGRIKIALEHENFDSGGFICTEKSYIFDEIGNVSAGLEKNSLIVSFFLGLDETVKLLIISAIQELGSISFSTIPRFKDEFGGWHDGEKAYIAFAHHLVVKNTKAPHHRAFAELLHQKLIRSDLE